MFTRFAKSQKDFLRPVDLRYISSRNLESSPNLLLVRHTYCDRLPRRGNCFAKTPTPNLIFKNRSIGSVCIFSIQT